MQFSRPTTPPLIAICALLLACNDGAPPTSTGGGGDVVTIEADVPGTTVFDTQEPKDVGMPVDGTVPDIAIAEGEFGWPCTSGDDCLSGLCVEGPEGQVCTETCVESCADGWVCKPLANAGQDIIVVCVYPDARLCWPCGGDSDCRSATTDPGAHCIDHGDEGSFCGVACGTNEYCLDGYSCAEVTSTGGQVVKQCVPDSGQCGCTPYATELALQTTCSVTNEFGSCGGIRRCEAGGLTGCNADVPALEVCDGVDNDCDGLSDGPTSTDCVTYFSDADNDKYGIGFGECMCWDPGAGFSEQGGDCNDVNGGINPGVQEVCNFADDDCDGSTDEEGALGCTSYFPDADLDGYGGILGESCTCGAPGNDFILVGGDCDDTTKKVSPDAKEICDGIDNDCDGLTDEQNAKGCSVYYVDTDGDGYGKNGQFKCLCAPEGEFTSDKGGDCKDGDADVHPFAVEICNQLDDDCDGVADQDGTPGCIVLFKDADEDGFGVDGDSKCFCQPQVPYTASMGGDCDDESKKALPGGIEVCDNLDNDCNGQTDEAWGTTDCQNYWVDKDKDTFGAGEPECLCVPSATHVATNGADCNDNDPTAYPGAQETCAPADENCNGQVNEPGAFGCINFHKDEDQDGYGIAESLCVCGDTPPYTASQAGDCYDKSNKAYPGQPAWFKVHRGDGKFDYDCDGSATRRWTQSGGHCDDLLGFCSATQVGFKGGIPACGASGSWLYGCDSGFFDCDDETETRVQECR